MTTAGSTQLDVSTPSFEDLLWRATRSVLSSSSPEIEDGFYRAAILHWFNPRLVRATNRSGYLRRIGRRREHPANPEALSEELSRLPFAEEYPERGFNIHSATRQTALEHLVRQEPAFYRTVSRQAARFFGRRMGSKGGSYAEDLVEWFYHQLVVDEDEAIATGASILGALLNSGDATYAHAMTVALEEKAALGHVSGDSLVLGQLWRAQIALTTEQFKNAIGIASEVASGSPEDVPIDLRVRAAEICARAAAAISKFDEAARWYHQILELAEHSSDAATIARIGLAGVLRTQNQYERAEALYREALEIYVPLVLFRLTADQLGAQKAEIEKVLRHVGSVQSNGTLTNGAAGDDVYLPGAVFASNPDAWFRANEYPMVTLRPDENGSSLGRFGDYGWPVLSTPILANAWRSLASLYVETNRFAEAKRSAELAVQIARDVDDQVATSQAIEVLYQASGSVFDLALLEVSIAEHEIVLDLADQLNDRGAQTQALLWLGMAHMVLSEFDLARAKYTAATEHAEATGNAYGRAQALEGLGAIAWSEALTPSRALSSPRRWPLPQRSLPARGGAGPGADWRPGDGSPSAGQGQGVLCPSPHGVHRTSRFPRAGRGPVWSGPGRHGPTPV